MGVTPLSTNAVMMPPFRPMTTLITLGSKYGPFISPYARVPPPGFAMVPMGLFAISSAARANSSVVSPVSLTCPLAIACWRPPLLQPIRSETPPSAAICACRATFASGASSGTSRAACSSARSALERLAFRWSALGGRILIPGKALPSAMGRIEADLLIPGRGDPIPNGCIVFDGPSITYAGPVEGAPRATAGTKVDRVPVVLPGLWDCHGHLMGLRSANIEEFAKTALPVLAARAVADARRALLAGFTSVRDLVGLGVHLARTVDEGTIPGPHIHGGGAMLTPTAGHGDLHMFPTSYMRTLEAGGHYVQLCDGVAECLRGVRNQLRVGARVIKVCASGGVMSETDHPIHQQFSEDELRAIVGEAGRAERIVAAHCHGKPGIMAALRAGCGTIEHGSYLRSEEHTSELQSPM